MIHYVLYSGQDSQDLQLRGKHERAQHAMKTTGHIVWAERFTAAQGMLTGQACSAQRSRSHLGQSGCPQTPGSAGLGALIWRSRQRRSKLVQGPTQAMGCRPGGPRNKEPCLLRSILDG